MTRLRLQFEIEQFYYEEANLLDERRFDEWLKLFSTEVSYWAPVRINREGAPDVVGESEMAFFEDDFGTLEVRAQLRAQELLGRDPAVADAPLRHQCRHYR